jgi:hypothetical protein
MEMFAVFAREQSPLRGTPSRAANSIRFEAGTGAPSVVPATELRPDPFSVPLSSRGIARLDRRETKWLSTTFWLARSTLRDGVEDLVSLDLKAAQD